MIFIALVDTIVTAVAVFSGAAVTSSAIILHFSTKSLTIQSSATLSSSSLYYCCGYCTSSSRSFCRRWSRSLSGRLLLPAVDDLLVLLGLHTQLSLGAVQGAAVHLPPVPGVVPDIRV